MFRTEGDISNRAGKKPATISMDQSAHKNYWRLTGTENVRSQRILYPNKVPKFEERTSPSIFSFFPFDESLVQILQQRRSSIEEQQRSKTNISTSSVDSKES
ncbi:hypothetical protein M9H77_19881 [Catharanthus roseus]|uniref:Uncharacterized protein n=1 Tax=Catharanthus roseus TaxID=4058 RepID=A0ACC0BBU0_CATRO|nr:hypothetical protein M9H77_19881 [Catharanthus roseus]